MFNIVIGAVMLVGGLSGKLALLGTNSSGAAAVVGGVLIGLGVYQVAKRRR